MDPEHPCLVPKPLHAGSSNASDSRDDTRDVDDDRSDARGSDQSGASRRRSDASPDRSDVEDADNRSGSSDDSGQGRAGRRDLARLTERYGLSASAALAAVLTGPGRGAKSSPVPVGGGLVFDEEFKAGRENLGNSVNFPVFAGRIAWLRPSQLWASGSKTPKTAVLFPEGGQPLGPVLQGNVCDEWFLGALSVLAARPDLVRALFTLQVPERGLFHVALHKMGTWIEVVVDDTLPVTPSATAEDPAPPPLLFAAPRARSGEIWACLLEKAYAKLHGSYAAIEYGHSADAVADLTGAVVSCVGWNQGDLTSSENSGILARPLKLRAGGELWAHLGARLRRGDLAGAIAVRYEAKAPPAGGAGRGGIAGGLTYGLTSVVEHRGAYLVRLRSLWSPKAAWSGAYGNADSSFWTPEVRRELGFDPAADPGEFHMPWDDFMRVFGEVFTARLFREGVDRRVAMQGSWSRNANTAAGASLDARSLSNPQYRLVIESERGGASATPASAAPVLVEVVLQLEQTDPRMNDAPQPVFGPVMIYVFEASGYLSEWRTPLAKSAFCELRQVNIELRLAPGSYVIVPCTAAGAEGIFNLACYVETKAATACLDILAPPPSSSTLPANLSLMLGSTKETISKFETQTEVPHAFHGRRFPISEFAKAVRFEELGQRLFDQRGEAAGRESDSIQHRDFAAGNVAKKHNKQGGLFACFAKRPLQVSGDGERQGNPK